MIIYSDIFDYILLSTNERIVLLLLFLFLFLFFRSPAECKHLFLITDIGEWDNENELISSMYHQY